MKRSLFLVLLLVVFGNISIAQVTSVKSITMTSDTLSWEVPEFNAKGSFIFQELDSVTNVRLPFKDSGVSLRLYCGADQLSMASPKAIEEPQSSRIQVKRQNSSKSVNVIFMPAFKPVFDPSYNKKVGQVIIENRPVYELVNIAFSLTEKGSKDAMTFNLNSEYYKKVYDHFGELRRHPLILMLNSVYRPTGSEYRMYRESAYTYSFDGDRIIKIGPYRNFQEGNAVIEQQKLWEDFAKKSHFLSFYANHGSYYSKEIESAKKMLPISDMWKWCEQKFDTRYHTYRIIISPLVNGFHSTQNIITEDFRECIMFICGPSVINPQQSYSAFDRAIFSAILFTEIDHNYVNPVSDKYERELNEVFGNNKWFAKGSQAEGYGNGEGYFNEYMTHSLFLLYSQDMFTKEVLNQCVAERTSLMTARGFTRFPEFYEKLKELYAEKNTGNDLKSIYPRLIEWGRQI